MEQQFTVKYSVTICSTFSTVELPPQKMDTDASKILVFDQAELEKEKLGKGDNKTETRLNIEVSHTKSFILLKIV